MHRLAVLWSTFGCLGYAPVAPGTVGSLGGLAVWLGLRTWGAGAAVESVTIVAVTLLGVWAAAAAERHFGRSDPGQVVVDEVAGMLVSLAFVDFSPAAAITGFLLFRLFDIVKPFPADRAERLPGGWGIMVDDIVAGLYANLTLRLIALAVPGFVG